MTMDGEFCVVCGRTDQPLVDGVCASCFLQTHTLVRAPGQPDVVVCPTCGARKVGSHWERSGASPSLLTSEDLNPLLELDPEVGLRRVRWTETARDAVQRSYRGEAEIRFRGLERTVGVDLSLKLRAYTCPECARKAGRFYTALIQVRGPSERLRGPPRLLRERLEVAFEGMLPETKSEWRKALSWREELPEGWDYYLTDTLAARAIARFAKDRLGASLKESATLYGRRNGQDVYRVTFRLRLPDPGGPGARKGRSAGGPSSAE
jgi:nonsense-mediated mRNA decay protein 3